MLLKKMSKDRETQLSLITGAVIILVLAAVVFLYVRTILKGPDYAETPVHTQQAGRDAKEASGSAVATKEATVDFAQSQQPQKIDPQTIDFAIKEMDDAINGVKQQDFIDSFSDLR
jgi:hypothetical protein